MDFRPCPAGRQYASQPLSTVMKVSRLTTFAIPHRSLSLNLETDEGVAGSSQWREAVPLPVAEPMGESPFAGRP